MQTNQFRYQSFAPSMPWKDAVCPNTPVNIRRESDTIRWDTPAPATDGDLPKRYVVYRFDNLAEAVTHLNDGKKVYAIVSGNKIGLASADVSGNSYFMVTSLDKNNNESEGAISSITLPVTGLGLNVTLSGNIATVDWITLTEINTRSFEVERSTDGRNFKHIATVTAAGTSNGEKKYRVRDLLTAAGTYYYRVKNIDGDGRIDYSMSQRIVYRDAGNEIVIGPNPFKSGINISNLHQVKRLDIIDLSGRIIISRMLNNQQSIRLEASDLPAGLYYLKVTKTNGEYFYRKVVKL